MNMANSFHANLGLASTGSLHQTPIKFLQVIYYHTSFSGTSKLFSPISSFLTISNILSSAPERLYFLDTDHNASCGWYVKIKVANKT
jgi:hypothetical protein